MAQPGIEEAVSGRAECRGYGDSFPVRYSQALGTPQWEQFCTPECQADSERGLNRAQVRRRIFREANG
jgi:hypothetical protein